MMGVSTRDLVYLLLSIPFFLIVMLTPSLRLGFSTVIKAFFARKLVIVTLSMLLWISASVVLLKFLSLWNCTHIWPTVVWTAAFAFATLFEATRVSYQKHLGRRVFLESIGVIALVEFFLHLYTFPFLVELLLVPIWLLFSIVYIYTEGKPKHASAKALAGWGLLLISVGIFFYTFYKIITDADNFLSINTLHTFLLPIFLTILYIPFLFMLQSYSLYETVSIRLGNNQTFPKDNLHNYALRKAIVSFFPSLYLLDRWSLHCMQNQSQIETKAGIDGTV
ncbi:MAG: hypothetical protein OXQ96_04675, partial [Alphaproteobacteria bacterium]|nr:hypothetical protein [Alphaproteobacteria bacterium]